MCLTFAWAEAEGHRWWYALNFVVGSVNFVVHLLRKFPFLCSDVAQ
jgi:hypothetical protein